MPVPLKQLLLFTCLILIAACGPADKQVSQTPAPPGVAVKDTITFVEIGSLHCKPCQMMMPILDSLRQKYADRVAVKFIDIEKNPDQARLLKVMTIPTQIIYDRRGLAKVHHVGFFPQEQIEKELEKMLISRPAAK